MNRLRSLLPLATLLLAACSAGTATPVDPGVVATAAAPTIALLPTQAIPPTVPPAAPLDWQVAFLQNGAEVPVVNDIVTLTRAPFTLRVTLPTPVAVKLNLSTSDGNFQALQPGFVFTEDCLLALCTGMDVAEDRLNVDQTLFVDAELTHYLYYLAPDDHRWSRADVTAERAIFERDVAVLSGTPIELVADPELYLLLFANAANEQQIDPGELKKIIVSFAAPQ